KRLAFVHRVMRFSQLPADVHEPGGHQSQSAALKACNDFPYQSTLHAIRFDQHKSSFHCIPPKEICRSDWQSDLLIISAILRPWYMHRVPLADDSRAYTHRPEPARGAPRPGSDREPRADPE